MSEENVERFRQQIDAFRRGDWDAVAQDLDPHICVRTDPSWPEQQIYGREATVDWQRGAWELIGPDARIEESSDLGERVLARVHWKTRGQHSGIEDDLCFSVVSTHREGRIVFLEYFLEHEQALKAVGLAE